MFKTARKTGVWKLGTVNATVAEDEEVLQE